MSEDYKKDLTILEEIQGQTMLLIGSAAIIANHEDSSEVTAKEVEEQAKKALLIINKCVCDLMQTAWDIRNRGLGEGLSSNPNLDQKLN